MDRNKLIIGILSALVMFLGTAFIMGHFGKSSGKKKITEKYILFAGGTPDFFFSESIAKGAKQAANDLGVELELYWSNWDSTKMVVQFKKAIDQNPDGIAVMGHPGDKALSFLINEAIRKGIVVTSLNTTLPDNEAKYRNRGFGYVGQDVYRSGLDLARVSYEKFSLEPGDKVIFMGTEAIPVRGQRSSSARVFFEEKGLQVIYTEDVPFENFQDGHDWQVKKVTDLLKRHPDTVLIFDDINVSASVDALKKEGYPSDKFFLVGFDLSPGQLDDLKKGYIDLLSDQQPFLQGYLSLLQLAFSNRWHFSGLNINTGSGVVSSSTIYEIEQFVNQGIR